MSAERIVRRLLEEPDNDPLDIGPLERYTGPVEFNTDVKDILDHALFLKSQAEQAGALSPAVIGDVSSAVLNRPLLRIACEELDDEVLVDRTIKRLRRACHSIWM